MSHFGVSIKSLHLNYQIIEGKKEEEEEKSFTKRKRK